MTLSSMSVWFCTCVVHGRYAVFAFRMSIDECVLFVTARTVHCPATSRKWDCSSRLLNRTARAIVLQGHCGPVVDAACRLLGILVFASVWWGGTGTSAGVEFIRRTRLRFMTPISALSAVIAKIMYHKSCFAAHTVVWSKWQCCARFVRRGPLGIYLWI